MRNRARWRAALAKEKQWADAFEPHSPPLRAVDLVRGHAYLAVSRHLPGCLLHAGWKCWCRRPDVKFFATDPCAREKGNDLDYAA
jgi:hypothetical protein